MIDMKGRIVNDRQLSEKQLSTLKGIVSGEGPQATHRQIQYLKKLGVTVGDGITKKEASDLIGAALAKKAQEDEQ